MKKQKHGPVVYIDPITNKPKCSPIECKNKLVEYSEVKETNYKWVGGPVKHYFYYSICDECGTRTITNEDKKRTDASYKKAINVGNGIDPDIQRILENDYRKETQIS